LGLVRSTVEKLRPILEVDAKRREHDILRYCAQSALNATRLFDMVGKPMEFSSWNLENQPVDVKDLKGKVVLIVTTPYRWESEKIKPLKALYELLKPHGLEIILFLEKMLKSPKINSKVKANHGS